jgi:hypothetical protein
MAATSHARLLPPAWPAAGRSGALAGSWTGCDLSRPEKKYEQRLDDLEGSAYFDDQSRSGGQNMPRPRIALKRDIL